MKITRSGRIFFCLSLPMDLAEVSQDGSIEQRQLHPRFFEGMTVGKTYALRSLLLTRLATSESEGLLIEWRNREPITAELLYKEDMEIPYGILYEISERNEGLTGRTYLGWTDQPIRIEADENGLRLTADVTMSDSEAGSFTVAVPPPEKDPAEPLLTALKEAGEEYEETVKKHEELVQRLTAVRDKIAAVSKESESLRAALEAEERRLSVTTADLDALKQKLSEASEMNAIFHDALNANQLTPESSSRADALTADQKKRAEAILKDYTHIESLLEATRQAMDALCTEIEKEKDRGGIQ